MNIRVSNRRTLFTSLEGRSVLSKTQTLLDASFLHGKHDVLKEHLENNPVHPDFKGALKQGIELVLNRTRTMSEVAPTMKVLLQNGARWVHKVRLTSIRMTPYHVICNSTGDHHDLLELMIKELGRKLVNSKDDEECTALIYAVQNANIKCVDSLIANGADVNFIRCTNSYSLSSSGEITESLGPLIDSINLLHPKSPHPSNVIMDIFDLLLDNGADVNKPCIYHKRTPIMYAAAINNVKCVEKLIQKGAQVNYRNNSGNTLWLSAAKAGRVDMPKYLLEDNVKPCKVCGTNLVYNVFTPALMCDPCIRCINYDTPKLVRLLEEHGCQLYKHTAPLIYAIRNVRVKVVKYLLSNYKYPMNYEYIGTYTLNLWKHHHTLLTDACQTKSVEMVKILLDHDADPNKKSCAENCPSVFNVALYVRHVEVIACFIRGGLNVNTRSYYPDIGVVLPFEAAVSQDHIYVAELLLVAGCSCGVHNLDNTHGLKVKIKPELKELIKEWNVHKNNVIPLQRRCRMVILNHLSPQADKKIVKLQLPLDLVKYLSMPEIDDLMDAFRNNSKIYNENIFNKLYRKHLSTFDNLSTFQ